MCPSLESHLRATGGTDDRTGIREDTVRGTFGGRGGARCFSDFNPASGLYEMKAPRRAEQAVRALVASLLRRDVMEDHRLLAHSSEHIARTTGKAAGIKLAGEWKPLSGVRCDKDSPLHRAEKT